MSVHPLGVALPTRQDPVRVLDEMKRIAVEQLGGVPSGLYRTIEDALHQTIERPETAEVRHEEQMALMALRQRNATYVMRFRQVIAEGFDEFHVLPLQKKQEEPLRLVDDKQLGYHLAGQLLIEAIGKRYTRPLQMLDGRMESLAEALEQPAPSNPIGANRLAGAFVRTFRDAEIPDSLRQLLFHHYEQELGKVLGDLYGQINTLLASSGYGVHEAAAKPRVAAVPSANANVAPDALQFTETVPVVPSQASFSAYGAGGQAGASGSTAPQYDELRSLLHTWREGLLRHHGGGSVSADLERRVAPRRELRADEVVSVASLMQSDPPEPYVRALSSAGHLADAIREQLNDGARRLGLDPDKTRLAMTEEDAIDLVGMLFESLFSTHALLDRSRRLYARLVLPYVKVALLDEELFVKREHPARRLLDAITEACEGNDGANPQDRELLERAAGIAQRIVADYNEDIEIFELASEELEALLKQQHQRVAMIERRAAESVHGRERLVHARGQAAEALAHRLAQGPINQTVSEFLIEHWQHHLVQTALRDGSESERYADVLNLGAAIAEVDQQAALGNGNAVADQLIAMQPAITQCLASSGLDANAANDWLAGLVHALAQPDLPRTMREAPAREDEVADTTVLQLAGGTDTLEFNPALAERMRKLVVGEWVRLVNADGESASAKVAWISPLSGRYLMVNRRGIRVLVASAAEMAEMAGKGRLVVGTEKAPFDEAMRELCSRLGKVVGQN